MDNKKNSKLRQYFVSRLDQINSSSYMASLNGHGGIKGGKREDIILKFLKETLPSTIQFAQGIEILDKNGLESNEIDICIFDSLSPRIPIEGDDTIVFNDHVVCAIEIKSNLNDGILTDVINKSKVTKSLHRDIKIKATRLDSQDNQLDLQQESTITMVLAYKGWTATTLKNKLNTIETSYEHLPDLIVNTNRKYILIKDSGWLFSKSKQKDTYQIHQGDDILVYLYQYLYLLCESYILGKTAGYMDTNSYLKN